MLHRILENYEHTISKKLYDFFSVVEQFVTTYKSAVRSQLGHFYNTFNSIT